MPYAITIFVSAFLLFQVQPIIARFILPWYGGSPAVWSTSLLFFQVFLLMGYAYAHFIVRRLHTRQQVILHLALLGIALLLMPITPADALKPGGEDNPLLGILWLLGSTVGFPYLMISATGPLLQHWFDQTYHGKSPYRLYALSNLGSLLGLLTYPFLFERLFELPDQTLIWSASFGFFVVLCGWAGIVLFKAAPTRPEPKATAEPKNTFGFRRPAMWVGLAACGSTMLLATTNKLTQDVAVVPFLWVLPLSLYLLTFIIAFDSPRWYRRGLWIPLFVISAGLMAHLLNQDYNLNEWEIVYQVAAYSIGLFCICLVCHGEMVRLKPDPSHLTWFYLLVATGGALGGLFVNFVAPALFPGFWEFHIGLLITFCLCGYVIFKYNSWQPARLVKRLAVTGWIFLTINLAGFLYWHIDSYREGLVKVSRNFYGVLRVYELGAGSEYHLKALHHGRINHGLQFMAPAEEFTATSYYNAGSGIGRAIDYFPNRINRTLDQTRQTVSLRIGILGLGVGTIAAYCKPGDYFRFYELNPSVVTIAETDFSFLSYNGCDYDIVIGDGRISLERELAAGQAQKFDILAIDAFSGDAIPVHLLTLEAFEMYFRHLHADGIVAVHITNQHLDLRPVVFALARQLGKEMVLIKSRKFGEGIKSATWCLLTNNSAFLSQSTIGRHLVGSLERDSVIWTDNYSNLFQVLKHK